MTPDRQEHGPCYDTLFLAITRMACVYGVPLVGFIIGVGIPTMIFDLTSRYNLVPRLLFCVPLGLGILAGLTVLTSHEPKWFQIGSAWLRTRLPVLFARATRTFGGTTFCPLPVGRSYAELRDYAG